MILRDIDHKFTCLIHDQARKWKWLDTVMIFLARDLLWALALVPFIALLFLDVQIAFVLVGAGVGSLFLTFTIQALYDRDRPFQDEHVRPLFKLRIPTRSFPSGHAALSWAIALSAGRILSLLGFEVAAVLCLTAAALITYARAYAGLHYVSDLVIGVLIGFLSAELFLTTIAL